MNASQHPYNRSVQFLSCTATLNYVWVALSTGCLNKQSTKEIIGTIINIIKVCNEMLY